MQVTIDMDTLKLIAQAAAEAAAGKVSDTLRDEQRRDFDAMERRLTDKMDAYFGQLDSAKHVVQHDRIERLLALFDRMGENIFSTILKNVLWGMLVLGVIGWLVWKKMSGGLG